MKNITDKELGDVLGEFYLESPEPKPNFDTSTEEGRAWRLHVLQKPLREWRDRESSKDYDAYFDER